QFFAPRDDAAGNPVINADSGAFALAENESQTFGDWTATGTPVQSEVADHDLSLQSIAIQKTVANIDFAAPSHRPGNRLEWTLQVQVSDFFAFDNLVVDDTYSDGQSFDTTFIPTLSWSASNSGGATAVFDLANFTHTPLAGGGDIVFRLSNELALRSAGDARL